MKTLDVYTTPACGFCKVLKENLGDANISYNEHDVTQDADALAEMKALSGGSMSVPVAVLDKDLATQEVRMGFQDIMMALELGDEQKEVASEEATLTCPKCNHQQKGEIPTTSCVPFYDCEGCNETIGAAEGDCCVYCSYADKACPLKKDAGCSDGACSI